MIRGPAPRLDLVGGGQHYETQAKLAAHGVEGEKSGESRGAPVRLMIGCQGWL